MFLSLKYTFWQSFMREFYKDLVILPFYRAQTKDFEGSLRKRAMKFEVEVLDTPNFHRTHLI